MPKATGGNQHRENPILRDHPELPDILQKYINEGVRQKDIPGLLMDEYHWDISLRSIQRISQECDLQTVRRSKKSAVEKGVVILAAEVEDPLGRLGSRKLKEKLATNGDHISRDFIQVFRKADNPAGAASRHPITRKIHYRGITCSGPSEEWCVDGHEKIALQMGISVWGIIDKFSRMELGLWAVPNARNRNVPPTLFLYTVKKFGGFPLSTASDMGTEQGQLINIQNVLRQRFLPALDINLVPPHVSVKSVYNITRERGWRPIWEQGLENILYMYNKDKLLVGYQDHTPLHKSVALWVWSQVVQAKLDEIVRLNRIHYIRKQRKIFLPSGGRPIDFWSRPSNYGGTDQLISIPEPEIDRLIAEFADPTCLSFGDADTVSVFDTIWTAMASTAAGTQGPNASMFIDPRFTPEMIAKSQSVIASLAASQDRNLALSHKLKRPIGKSKLKGLDNRGLALSNAGRVEVKLMKVSNRYRGKPPSFDASMRAYPLDTMWTHIKADFMSDIDEAYTTSFNHRITDFSQFVLYFWASKTKIPEEFDGQSLRAMWNTVSTGSAVTRQKRSAMVLEIYAVVNFSPSQGPSNSDDGETAFDTTASSASTLAKRKRKMDNSEMSTTSASCTDPQSNVLRTSQRRKYLTVLQYQGTTFSVKRIDCDIKDGSAVWTASPKLFDVVVHSDILASGLTKHAYMCNIDGKPFVAKNYFNTTSTVEGSAVAQPLRVPNDTNLSTYDVSGSLDLAVSSSFILAVSDGHEKGMAWIVDPQLSTTKVEKFSGTVQAGNHKSLLGMTCDALAHFSAYDSDLDLVLVDIQGIVTPSVRPDGGRGPKVFNLFDLMIHSANKSYGLGDAGAKGIEQFLSQHECNRICRALRLHPKQGCDGATLGSTQVTVAVTIGFGVSNTTPDQDNDDTVSSADLGSVFFESSNAESVKILTYSADEVFKLGDSTTCHLAQVRSFDGSKKEPWTILLEDTIQKLSLEDQDAALYRKLARHAGVDGLLDRFGSAIDFLSIPELEHADIEGVSLLPCYLLKPVQDDLYFTFSKANYALVLGTPQHVSEDTDILRHNFEQTSFASLGPNDGFSTDSSITAATYLDAFSHFLYVATSGEMVLSNLHHFVEKKEVVIVKLDLAEHVETSVKAHVCNVLCKGLNLPSCD
ncbi:hypothetical protein MD484_g7001, partial [Candolleomyces efflorescens]